MIHVDRGQDPGVELQRRVAAARAEGKRPGFRVTDILLHERALYDLFHGKCAYCETLLAPRDIDSRGGRDYFKPEGVYPELESKWENLYLACLVCIAHKRAIDPVDRNTGRIWMLDPCAEDPQRFLQFEADGTVTSRANANEDDTKRAARTISALGLNREHLVAQRRQQIALVENIARELMSKQPENWNDDDSIQELISAEAPFAAAARDTLERLLSVPKGCSPSVVSAEVATSLNRPSKHAITFVTLDNIGPFEHIEIQLGPGWNLFDWLFDIVRDLMPGPDFEFDRLDRDTWQVLVKTNDGIIPIEQLSLGVVSTIGWIGTLLRRLAEAYPDSDTPELEPALVLIDEIDAHLHPSWQQRLVPLVRQRFPNLQVIAASHSALIANNLGPNEIVVLSRDGAGIVKPIRLQEPLQGLRADQVYTSEAFGLSATRGDASEQLMLEYKNALAAADGTPESKTRIADLA